MLSYIPVMIKWNLKLKFHIYISTPKMKYWGINLTKYVQDLYEKKYKVLMKAIKEELNKWGDTPFLWTGRLNIITCQFFPTWSRDSIQSQSKSQKIILWVLTNQFCSLYGEAEDPEYQITVEGELNLRINTMLFQDLI